MSNLTTKRQQQTRRVNRIRATLNGTPERPRLSVTISNKLIRAQVIDDVKGATIASASSQSAKGTLSEQAASVGTEIAKAAKAKKVKQVVLDRRGHQYHGRVKVLAEAARKAGLEF